MWEHSREVVSHLNILLQSMDLDHVQFIKCRCLGVTCTIPWDPFTVLTQSPVTASQPHMTGSRFTGYIVSNHG